MSSSSSGGSGPVCSYTPGCYINGPYSLINDYSANGYWTSFENQLASLGCGVPPFQGSTYAVEAMPIDSSTTQYSRYTTCPASSTLDALIHQYASATEAFYCDSCLSALPPGRVRVRWYTTTTPFGDVCPGGCNGNICTSCL